VTLTVAKLRASKWQTILHARLSKGGSLYHYRSLDFPRLVVSHTRESRRSPASIQYAVDGHVVATIEEAVALLNGPVREPPRPTPTIKALTIWQPWASLVMIGAKPLEFRDWDYRSRFADLEGRRIVVHAGARSVKPVEVEDLISRCRLRDRPSLIVEKALPLLERLQAAYRCQGVVEHAAGLGTAILGKPRRISGQFVKPDSDRVAHHVWAWPLSDVEPWPAPVPHRGFQGFWNWTADVPERVAA
jgi:hypothetical protein